MLCALVPVFGCAAAGSLSLEPVSARTAIVGEDLQITLRVDNADDVTFSYTSDLTLATRRLKPDLTSFESGVAIFHWTPLSEDVGAHELTFTAKSATGRATQTVPVQVVPGVAPIVFREPVGDGTSFNDLADSTGCAEVAVAVDGSSAASVTLAPGTPWIDTATITQTDDLTGTLRFCPSATELATGSVFSLVITAVDSAGNTGEKQYSFVLDEVTAPSTGVTCDTTPPVITDYAHGDVYSGSQMHFTAIATDASGILGVYLYYSTTAPADPQNPDLTQMSRLDFVTYPVVQNEWTATIANPTADASKPAAQVLYYAVEAIDEADNQKGCLPNTAIVTSQFNVTRAQ